MKTEAAFDLVLSLMFGIGIIALPEPWWGLSVLGLLSWNVVSAGFRLIRPENPQDLNNPAKVED